MPLPFADFPASAATFDLGTGVISYEEAGALAASGEVLGEALAAAEVAAAAAVLAEPLLIIGAGVAAGAAAEAILSNIAPTAPKPRIRTMPFSGGRIGGGTFVTAEYKLKNAAKESGTFHLGWGIQGIKVVRQVGVALVWAIVGAVDTFYLLQADPTLVEEFPTITNITEDGTGTGQPKQMPLTWENPGTGALPVPTPVNISFPYGDPIVITPTPLPSPRGNDLVPVQTPVPIAITVAIPELGLVINFQPTNIVINYAQPWESPSVYAPPVNNFPQVKLPSNPCPCPPVDMTKILCLLRELETKLIVDGYDYSTHAGGSGQAGLISGLTDELFSVELEVTVIPQGEKVQLFPSPAADVYFFGWISWITGSLPGSRQPVSFASNTFRAPVDATGFVYGLHDGCSAVATYTTRKKKAFTSQC